MTLKGHKNLIADVATQTALRAWRPGGFMCFGPVKPDTLATSCMLGEYRQDQQGSSIERPTGVYLFRYQ